MKSRRSIRAHTNLILFLFSVPSAKEDEGSPQAKMQLQNLVKLVDEKSNVDSEMIEIKKMPSKYLRD